MFFNNDLLIKCCLIQRLISLGQQGNTLLLETLQRVVLRVV